MDIYSKRRRARRLNDPNKTAKRDDTDDKVDPNDLELNYDGVVKKVNDEEEKREQRKEFAKSVGSSSGPNIDFEEVWKGDREDDPDLELDYSRVLKDDDELEREELARAIADELERRSVTPARDDDVQKDARNAVKNLSTEVDELADMVQKYVEDRRGAA